MVISGKKILISGAIVLSSTSSFLAGVIFEKKHIRKHIRKRGSLIVESMNDSNKMGNVYLNLEEAIKKNDQMIFLEVKWICPDSQKKQLL